MKIIAKGLGASAGQYKGNCRIINSVSELDHLQQGEVLVIKQSNPTWTLGMLRAGAVVSELGGIISHAAIVAREMGIPCVVGAENATTLLTDGMTVLIDGEKGHIYKLIS